MHLTNYKTIFTLLFLFFLQKINAQSCIVGNMYGTQQQSAAGDAQRHLYRVDTLTGLRYHPTTNVRVDGASGGIDLFGGGAAAAIEAGDRGTAAIALQMPQNVIWFASRGVAGNAAMPARPRIFFYNLNTNTYGLSSYNFISGSTVVTGNHNINKAAYNPVDRKLYFHDATLNDLYVFDPAQPAQGATLIGKLSLNGTTATTQFSGGDIAFDGLGNLVGTLFSANRIAIFPGNYDASGNYTGLSLIGQPVVTLTQQATGLAFLPSGELIGGYNTNLANPDLARINTNNGTETFITGAGAGTTSGYSDLTSCAAPSPNLRHTKSASVVCSNGVTNIQYKIVVYNSGTFHAVNTRLIDVLPAGVTLTSATLNGASLNTNDMATAGVLVTSTQATTPGQIFKSDSAVVLLNCTAPANGQNISNQSFIKYNGIESLNLPNDQLPSDDPSTLANDVTTVSACVTITGTVYNDADGQTGGPNGTALPNVTLTLYAADNTTVLGTTVTNAAGQYVFSVAKNTGYTVAVTPPPGYSNVSSTDTTPADGRTDVSAVNTSITGVNFGVNQNPESYDVIKNVAGAPSNGTLYSLTDAPLQGSDPVEQPSQGSWQGKTIVITALPTNGFEMYYNGVLITSQMLGTGGYTITQYDPAKLQLKAATVPGGVKTTSFSFATIDAAGAMDATPATFTLNFSAGLPVMFGTIDAFITGNELNINWTSLMEKNNSHYEIEVSKNGFDFIKIGTVSTKAAGGNSDQSIEYNFSAALGAGSMQMLGASIFLLAGILLIASNKKNTKLLMLLPVLMAVIAFTSCNKKIEDSRLSGNTKVFVRIVQIDADGTKDFSQVILAIRK